VGPIAADVAQASGNVGQTCILNIHFGVWKHDKHADNVTNSVTYEAPSRTSSRFASST
jgi:hypothetical protein